MKTLEQFLSDYLGKSKGYPTDKEYLGECLSICKLYIKECFGINPPPSGNGSAYGYWSNFPNPLGEVFEKVLNTDDLIPQKGWIAIWQPWASNPHGHISIVADGSTTGTLKNWAQNWTSKIFQLESNRYTNVVGFLKPKESIISDMTEEEKKLLGLISDNSLSEGDLRWLVDLKKNNTVSILEGKVKDLETKIDGLNTTISDQYKEMDKKNLEYGKLLEEYNTLLPKYEELLKDEQNQQTTDTTANKFNLIQFIISLFKK